MIDNTTLPETLFPAVKGDNCQLLYEIQPYYQFAAVWNYSIGGSMLRTQENSSSR
jgi:hypothetical protein